MQPAVTTSYAAYPAQQALELVKSLSTAKFDETIDAVLKLGIDPRKADQLVRGTVALPHGTGKDVRVAVFAPADRHAEAKPPAPTWWEARNWSRSSPPGRALDFDLVIATPDMMAEVGKLGRVLGPRGLMPNPKAGTVTPDVGKTVEEFKAGKIEYRNDRYGNVHVPVGKSSFEVDQLLGNLSSKGRYEQVGSPVNPLSCAPASTEGFVVGDVPFGTYVKENHHAET
jgi:large subunit ribosomal protein L1